MTYNWKIKYLFYSVMLGVFWCSSEIVAGIINTMKAAPNWRFMALVFLINVFAVSVWLLFKAVKKNKEDFE